MEDIKAIFEEHPYIIGSVLLGIVVLFVVSRSSGSASTGTPVAASTGQSDAVTAAQLTASTNSLALQSASQQQVNDLNYKLQSQQLTDATAITLQQIQYGTYKPGNTAPVTGGTTSTGTPPVTTTVIPCTGTSADINNPACNAPGFLTPAPPVSSVMGTLFGTTETPNNYLIPKTDPNVPRLAVTPETLRRVSRG